MKLRHTLLLFAFLTVYISIQAQSELMRKNSSGTMFGYIGGNEFHGFTYGYSSKKTFDLSFTIGKWRDRYPYAVNIGMVAFKNAPVSAKFQIGYANNKNGTSDGFNLGLRVFSQPGNGPIGLVPFVGVFRFMSEKRYYPEAGLFLFGNGKFGPFAGISVVKGRRETNIGYTAGFKFTI